MWGKKKSLMKLIKQFPFWDAVIFHFLVLKKFIPQLVRCSPQDHVISSSSSILLQWMHKCIVANKSFIKKQKKQILMQLINCMAFTKWQLWSSLACNISMLVIFHHPCVPESSMWFIPWDQFQQISKVNVTKAHLCCSQRPKLKILPDKSIKLLHF